MTVIAEGPGELKMQELVAAIEDAAEGANLKALGEDTLRDLEMRLASVCNLIGIERRVILDDYPTNDFGDALERDGGAL